jgi:hypothetical protein
MELTDNQATDGGAIYISNGSSVSLSEMAFVANNAVFGGAVFIGAAASITNCRFEGNGNALYCGGTSDAVVSDCVISGNSRAVLSAGASPTIARCLFDENSIYAISCAGPGSPLIESCTLNQNGVGVEVQGGNVAIERTIIAFSKGNAVLCAGGTANLSCCDLYGNLGGDWIDCIADQRDTNGNLAVSPRFCNAQENDFTIHGQSLCAPANSPPGCGLIGAFPVGCGVADVGTEEVTPADLRLTVIPNPVCGVARFELEAVLAPTTSLTIFDSIGRIVEQLKQQEGHWQWTPGSAVPSGVYFARPETEIGAATAVKFLYLR